MLFNGFSFWHINPGRVKSPYEGPQTPATEAKWDKLMDCELPCIVERRSIADQQRDLRIGITRAENEQLELPTVAAWDDSTVYPVVVAGFHHLHVRRALTHRSDTMFANT